MRGSGAAGTGAEQGELGVTATVHSSRYVEYLASLEWAMKRQAALERAGYECQSCGDTVDLQVHHLTYDRLGEEVPADLMVVCPPCHEKEDEARARRTEARSWARRVRGYARKRWGETWWLEYSFEEAAEELRDWIEQGEGAW